MSEDTRSYGLMAILVHQIDDTEEFGEMLREQNSLLQVNYEGTLVYFDETMDVLDDRRDIYGLWFGNPKTNLEKFTSQLKQFNLEIDSNSIEPFHCIWYNGSDSDMDMLTLAEFRKKTGR